MTEEVSAASSFQLLKNQFNLFIIQMIMSD